MLDEYVPLALAIHTEKARSEFIVAPILGEVRRLLRHRVSLFSGVQFDVEPALGLTGTCDFLLADSPLQSLLIAPVLVVVEAKNDSIKSGLGQCVATMAAARLFNEREQVGPSTIQGVVTTGSLWKFLRLEGEAVSIGRREYYLDQVETILAILVQCMGGDPASSGVAA